MFGFRKKPPVQLDAVQSDIVLPYPPVIIRPENLPAIKVLLADLTEANIRKFLAGQKNFSYTPVAENYPFGSVKEPPVFAQFWEYEGMKDCCKVLCLLREDKGFTLITKAEHKLLTLFPGDKEKGFGPAALVSVPNAQGGVNMSVSGDGNVFRGIVYLEQADAARYMSERHAEAVKVASHRAHHKGDCSSCPTGHEAQKSAAQYTAKPGR
jgi:hypothetical protein